MILALLATLAVVQPDTTRPRLPTSIAETPRPAGDTTQQQRPRTVELSDWYHRRLVIHRTLAYATVPLFVAQYAAGEQLFEKGSSAPGWAKTTHRFGAASLAGVFTVNTVTGVWNLWETRQVRQGRGLRTAHALSMLAADAAFTYSGIKLSEDAENSLSARRRHRTVAVSAMGVTVASGLMMKLFNE